MGINKKDIQHLSQSSNKSYTSTLKSNVTGKIIYDRMTHFQVSWQRTPGEDDGEERQDSEEEEKLKEV